MKENPMDVIFALGKERIKGGLRHINREYGKVKPFNTELMPSVDILYTYDKLMLPENQDIRTHLIQLYGAETFVEMGKVALNSRKARGL